LTLSSTLARNTKQAIRIAAERVWAYGFTILGYCFRSPRNQRISPWSSPGSQRILVIAPHPDDEAAGCAGTLVQHKKCADKICIVYVTDGRRSCAWGLGPEEMAHRRWQEAEAGVRTLGADRFEWLGLPEGEWSTEQLLPRLQALIDRFAPHLIYAPSRIDFHPEHRQVAYVLATLLADKQRELPALLIRIYQAQVPLTAVLTNLVANTSNVTTEMTTVLKSYSSQWDSIARALRQRRYAACYYHLTKQAEEFWQLTTSQYCLLHRFPPEHWRSFRSLRSHPFYDPLAYLQGLRERQRLARLVRQADCQT
jgi:LmbE family N-acetylglucosaminyl deacetylase